MTWPTTIRSNLTLSNKWICIPLLIVQQKDTNIGDGDMLEL